MKREVKLTDSNLDEVSKKVADILDAGGIAVIPFDTVYGFICDPKNDTALERIYKLKGRDFDKTIGLAFDSIASLNNVAYISDLAFIEDKVPGKFTFIVKAKDKSFSLFCYRQNTIGARIPDSILIKKIASKCGGAIAQTSANKAGEDNCGSLNDLARQFSEKELLEIDIVVDGGKMEDAQPSQIFDLTGSEPKRIER